MIPVRVEVEKSSRNVAAKARRRLPVLELENAKKNLAAVFDVCAFRTFLDGGFSEKVFIVTDQQRYDTIRALGFDYRAYA